MHLTLYHLILYTNFLDFSNFGPMIIKWVELFYKDAKTSVQMNGFLSEFFRIERGLNAEILAIKIRNNPDVKGICINGTEYKISQFADDTSLLLDGSEKSLHSALKMLEHFAV
jgi:hypothetical protein